MGLNAGNTEGGQVEVIGKQRLMAQSREQSRRHVECVRSVIRWLAIVSAATWQNPADVRQTIGTVDFVQGKAVFNIHGNDYRLITIIDYAMGRVYVEHLLSHKEYDKGAWKSRP